MLKAAAMPWFWNRIIPCFGEVRERIGARGSPYVGLFKTWYDILPWHLLGLRIHVLATGRHEAQPVLDFLPSGLDIRYFSVVLVMRLP